jgi:hypothetical protein
MMYAAGGNRYELHRSLVDGIPQPATHFDTLDSSPPPDLYGWSPNGSHLAATLLGTDGHASDPHLYEMRSDLPQLLAGPELAPNRSVADYIFAPDSEHVALRVASFGVATEEPPLIDVIVLDLATGDWAQLNEAGATVRTILWLDGGTSLLFGARSADHDEARLTDVTAPDWEASTRVLITAADAPQQGPSSAEVDGTGTYAVYAVGSLSGSNGFYWARLDQDPAIPERIARELQGDDLWVTPAPVGTLAAICSYSFDIPSVYLMDVAQEQVTASQPRSSLVVGPTLLARRVISRCPTAQPWLRNVWARQL